jgi:hypothetical protein
MERKRDSFVQSARLEGMKLRPLKFLCATSLIAGTLAVSGCATDPWTTADGSLAPALGQAADERDANAIFASPSGGLLAGPVNAQEGEGARPFPLARCVDRFVSGRCARWR